MGWVSILVLAALTAAALWPFFRRDKAALQLLGATLLVALAGYAMQGRPAQEGSPKPPPERQPVPDSDFARTRGEMMGQFDRASFWLTMSEGYARRGDTQGAVQVIQSGLRDSPQDPDLWVGLGSALVAHADGMITPAAEMAFRRAQRIAPEHPAPPYYFGLALAQAGNFDQAEQLWRRILADAPADASWRPMVEQQIQALQQARAMQGLAPAPSASAPGPAPAPAPSPPPR
ncbi:tetratricopeptide repeat protein [Sphingosinicella terrae]|uniref:tetratricopeptide repeat protein n=1 Tax=Sphingosinicella terrae TaxID=2172047 RepID=UPI000E0DE2C4|nr:tetratricopeptide repeat protein [Sphingosinicella terrae]